MSDHTVTSNQEPKIAPARNGVNGTKRHGDGLQVDMGKYRIFQQEIEVGELLVVYDPAYNNDARHMIEYWCLYPGYAAPSQNHRDASLRIAFETLDYDDAAQFKADMQANHPGARFIKAVCAEETF